MQYNGIIDAEAGDSTIFQEKIGISMNKSGISFMVYASTSIKFPNILDLNNMTNIIM